MIPELLIREGNASDIPFIYKTWLNGLWDFAVSPWGMPQSRFFHEYREVIDHILTDPKTIALIASVNYAPQTILAYMIIERESPAIHFAFTKGAMQRMGLQKALFNHAFPNPCEIEYTHRTRLVRFLRTRSNLKFNQFRLYKRGEHG